MRCLVPALALAAVACSSGGSDRSTSDAGSEPDAGVSDAAAERADAGQDTTAAPAPFRVMTFNVLCSTFCDSTAYDPWEERLAYFEDIFARHDADLVGLQELSPPLRGVEEVDEILAIAPGYSAVYYAPDDALSYPDATILYRTERFTVLESGEYWLGLEPDSPGTEPFADGTVLRRLVVWARLEEAGTGRELLFATTHFDNNSPAQDFSAELVVERTTPWVDTPVIFTGDFNSQPSDTAFLTLTEDDGRGWAFTDTLELAGGVTVDSNQTPEPAYDTANRIDHVFVTGPPAWSARDWTVDLTLYGPNDRYPSDHRAIVVTVEY